MESDMKLDFAHTAVPAMDYTTGLFANRSSMTHPCEPGPKKSASNVFWPSIAAGPAPEKRPV